MNHRISGGSRVLGYALRLVAVGLGWPALDTLKAAPAIAPVPADHAQQMGRGLELFKSQVGPIFRTHCLDCHGGEKVKGDFDLATREALLEGGLEGAAIIPGNAAGSRLMKLLRHEEEPHMPSKKPALDPAAIDVIASWIDAGAPYDQPLTGSARTVRAKDVVTEQDRNFWSFRPLQKAVPPPVANEAWVRTPVDRFVLAKLEEQKIRPNDELARRKLIRRATFDLIGLPPTPEEVDHFVRDVRPDAYERLVDRLLANPHYGERWGRHWLDVARFAESHGYEQDYDRPFAYHYRDYVIRALNDDQPFDEFVRWQIAGDELAPDNPQAWFATGFLGAGTHATQITANQAEKERYDELDDKIATIGTAMLGVTIGCARCHDHKFDPIPTQDYYRLAATFTHTVRSDHDVDLHPVQTRADLARWMTEQEPLQQALAQYEQEALPQRLAAWLEKGPVVPEPEWLGLELLGARASGGYFGISKTAAQGDGSWLVNIVAGSPDTLSFRANLAPGQIGAIRVEALADRSLPEFGPGWAKDGGFTLTELKVTAKPRAGNDPAVPLVVVRRTSTTDAGAVTPPLPWEAGSGKGRDKAAVFALEHPVTFAGATELAFELKFPAEFDRNLIGRIRVSVSTRPVSPTGGILVAAGDIERARAALARPRREWTAAQEKSVLAVYRKQDDGWLRRAAALAAHRRTQPQPTLVKAMVCSEGLPAIRLHTQGPDFFEQTYVLKRGDLAQKEAEAPQGFLQVLMRGPEGEKRWLQPPPASARTPHRRAALARWITDVDHGAGHLLARVIVNRLWQHHFGRGLVATPSDFGATGDAPTHPELLDWLARSLLDHGWRLQPLHRLIMTSATYRQRGDVDEARRRVDPENRLWWHRPPLRLEAEVIRDAMLAVSGRLDRTLYGPGLREETMVRRSVYFFAKRSQLTPMLVQFDAPDTLQSVGRRMNTTVAPQALLMLNNAQVRACARDFAERLRSGVVRSRGEALELAYRLAFGRLPTPAERQQAEHFLETQARTYPGRNEQAAWVDFCHVLLALNEFVFVE